MRNNILYMTYNNKKHVNPLKRSTYSTFPVHPSNLFRVSTPAGDECCKPTTPLTLGPTQHIAIVPKSAEPSYLDGMASVISPQIMIISI